MSGIDITHPHSLPPEQARTAVEDVAGKLAQRFDMQTAWEGDTLRFKRSGSTARSTCCRAACA